MLSTYPVASHTTHHQPPSPTHEPRPLKQGWVFKRGSNNIFSQWKLKFLVLTADTHHREFVLRVFDTVDQSRGPKHEVLCREMRVVCVETEGGSMGKYIGLKKGGAPFLVVWRGRKFYFAAQTRGDRDDWLAILQHHTKQPIVNNPHSSTSPNHPPLTRTASQSRHQRSKSISYLPTPSQTASVVGSSTDLGGSTSTVVPPNTTQHSRARSSSRYRTWSRRDGANWTGSGGLGTDMDDDAVSVYSQSTTYDDSMSVVSGMSESRGGMGGHRPHRRSADDVRSISVASSHVSTLSFCSEPVLTPQELNIMSAPTPLGAHASPRGDDCYTLRDVVRRRRAPLPQKEQFESPTPQGDQWNERYQSLLAMSVESEEAALRQDVQIVELIGQFQEVAQQHAKRIIDDYHVHGATHPWVEKTGSPIKLMSQTQNKVVLGRDDRDSYLEAGEQSDESFDERDGKRKCIVVDGMVLHFACDYDGGFNVFPKASDMQVRYLFRYLESIPAAVEEVLARTSAELRAINATTLASFSNGGPHLHTPLMALIDYKGFRVVAYADCGSGKTMHVYDLDGDDPRTDERAIERLASVGRALNLKPHTVQVGHERRVVVHTAASVQVDFNADTKTYQAHNLHDILPHDYYAGSTTSANVHLQSRPCTPTTAHPPTPLLPASSSPAAQSGPPPRSTRRLRPEFLIAYQTPISSDSLTIHSGAGRKEREVNDAECAKAGRFLRESWVPAFVKRLDEVEIRPVDSKALTGEMHRAGINIRYLGYIARLSTLPYIRDMASLEMVARTCKSMFRARLRGAILHFRSVGATQIDEEMRGYAANLFSTVLGTNEKSRKYFSEKIRVEVQRKFDYDLDYPHFAHIHRPALFLAMQYHCGVTFEDTTNYDFQAVNPIPRSRFVGFNARTKHSAGLPRMLQPTNTQPHVARQRPHPSAVIPEDERLAYHLARHFKSLGPRSKLARTDASATALAEVAAHYNATGRYEEAKMYAQASAAIASHNGCITGLAQGQLIEALFGLQPNPLAGPDPSLLAVYRQALETIKWHWGIDHPIEMALHDRVSSIYSRANCPQKALEHHLLSLGIAERSLGKNHTVTAGYLVKAGCLLLTFGQINEAIQRLTEALHIYQSLNSDTSLIAEVHYHLAEALAERGDLDSALTNAQRARKLREKCFGQMDPRAVETFRQVARLLLAPYKEYTGVLTPQIKAAYKEAITCHEKVFRYLKTIRGSSSNMSSGLSSSAASVHSTSSISIYQQKKPPSNTSITTILPSTSLLASSGFPHPVAGPLVCSPFHPPTPFPRSLLHRLTRQIVSLKLTLLDEPRHRECVRTLRARNAEAHLDAHEAREVVLRLAAVSPSVYLDGVVQRIDQDDDSALEELAIVMLLCESETVGLAG
ncbi:hypothetical protein HK097_007820 [Rhizophlyctis rosea]|uniref:PH domain-containing protein n=1 Tax=Rhizophlyctis rosea TaxID=64517 RepID=A0AAD5X1F3_9FUNG|nr:hypothetical protein HK097_007820 [Rhizophlyctis rosea]